MFPVLEVSQSLISSSQLTPFDVSVSSSRAFTPLSSDAGDSSIESKGLTVRPVVFNDFLDALTSLQNRVSLEITNETKSLFFVVFLK